MSVSSHEVTAEVVCVPAAARQVKIQHARPHCARCLMREWCLSSGGLASTSTDCMDNLMFGRRRIWTGESLYREGEPFKLLYEVRSGNLKSSLTTARGQERVSGFHMAGELMGLDGVANGRHASSATALEDTEVCAVSYALLTELAASNTGPQRTLVQQLSREIVRELRLKDRTAWLGNAFADLQASGHIHCACAASATTHVTQLTPAARLSVRH